MLESLIDRFGEATVALTAGLVLGAAFGALARASRFCLRSAVLDSVTGKGLGALAVWLAAAGLAIAGTQALVLAGIIDPAAIRLLTGSASISGVIIGGLLFGAGMVLARGCVSRLMVLSAGGNLRALVTLAVFATVAYATMKGPLGDVRTLVNGLAQTSDPAALSVVGWSGIGTAGALASGLAIAGLAVVIALGSGTSARRLAAGGLIGLVVAAAYGFTALLAAVSFDPQPVRGLSFIAPTVNSAATLIGAPGGRPDLEFALVPGVILGAFLVALLTRSFRVEWFQTPFSPLRYGFGGALMGFGGVLAGGCTMGNGLSGWAVYATFALVALSAVIIGAVVTHLAVDQPRGVDHGRAIPPVDVVLSH